ncbi:threonine synthase [Tieghemiomyces parasiticus]|uniref:threonine synthase n=1 Tax=Tieghemiomyces parasiticus TaxID=78921 RepID=A0A9W8DXU8_9FUNG|nr:threonine synthase [Tieghemiomyces parasiticus]
MHYHSTRGGASGYTFEAAVMQGLAPDGGLFIPEAIPELPAGWLTAWKDLSFQDLAVRIFRLFIDPAEIPDADLRTLVERSYGPNFRAPDVTPVRPLGPPAERRWILELFHGPTFAFKDVALQFLGNLFEYFLERRNRQAAAQGSSADQKEKPAHFITVVGATSGDTGSAAIYGLRNKKNVQVFILHPKGRVSPIQEAQMTTVLDANIHNLAVQGTFDDCQDIVKALFGDEKFRSTYHLGAINSINWARILAQTVYYFHSYFALARQAGGIAEVEQHGVVYTVPTGNFGDVLAGYYARRLGLPIRRLVVATNANDILHRFFVTGRYEKASAAEGSDAGGEAVRATHSPAMDILVSSNFERLMWYLAHYTSADVPNDADKEGSSEAACRTVRSWMDTFKATGTVSVEPAVREAAAAVFDSVAVSDAETLDTIRRYYHGATAPVDPYLLDPHTAVGVKAAEVVTARDPATFGKVYNVCLSTAHPAKFSAAVTEALTSRAPDTDEQPTAFEFDTVLPPEFVGLLDKPRRCTDVSPGTSTEVKRVIETTLESELHV